LRERESAELFFKVGTDTVNKMDMLSNAILNSSSPQMLGKRMNEHVKEGEYERLTWGAETGGDSNALIGVVGSDSEGEIKNSVLDVHVLSICF
jgi:hypothetical protein